jgi:hypothetical protein
MSSTSGAPARRRADGALAAPGGPSRRARALAVAAESALAGVVGGAVIGGAVGWTVAAAAVVLAGLLVALARRGGPIAGPGSDSADLLGRLRVVGVPSRSSGDVGVVGDGQGYAAGVEIDVAKGVALDLVAVAAAVAADPSRPSSVQLRLTMYAPPAPGSGVFSRPRGALVAVHRRLHLLVRLEPAWASDVVARHGGGAAGSRAALVAAVDRLAAHLRRGGVANRVLDPAALNALVAEDAAAELPPRLFAADPGAQSDLERLVEMVQQAGPERAVVSLCVDLAGSDQWQSSATVLIATRDVNQAGVVAAALLAERAVDGAAPAGALAAVLPLGGGPADLAAVLTLARV